MDNLSKKEVLTIQRILKVNHAGEYGAIRIYRAQIFIADLFYKDLAPKLREFLSHEIEHCKIFRAEMTPRKAYPCRSMFIWSWGGFILGLVTALLGRKTIMACTMAVEQTVHRHLSDQIHFLEGKDQQLKKVILDIQKQEEEHLDFAIKNIASQSFLITAVEKIVSVATDIVIFLSTWGDSVKMTQDLKNSKEKIYA